MNLIKLIRIVTILIILPFTARLEEANLAIVEGQAPVDVCAFTDGIASGQTIVLGVLFHSNNILLGN